MTDPFLPSQASLASSIGDVQLVSRRKFWLRAIWLSIAGVIIGPAFGLVGTVIALMKAFQDLSGTDEASTQKLSNDIGVSMVTTLWGIIFSMIAALFLIGSLIRYFTLPKVANSIANNHPSGS